MKKSRQVLLILSGAMAVAPLGCDDSPTRVPLASADLSYTNNYYIPSAGYYHAPFHAWYPQPYNFYDAARGYYYGGNWHPEPYVGGATESRPNPNSIPYNLTSRSSRSSSGSGWSSPGHSSSSTSRGGFGHSGGGSSGS